MKKTFFLLMLFIASSQLLSAQEIDDFIKDKIAFGLKGGFLQDYLNTSSETEFSELVVYGGFFTEVRLGRRFSLQSEVFYSTNRRASVSTPVLLKYHFNKKWSIMTGPRLDLATNSAYRITHSKPLAISLDLGIQYNINKNLFVEGRYSQGLSKNTQTLYPNPNIYNSVPSYNRLWRNSLTIGLGYKF